MSLVGNLEDLGLGEILQIVSLSRKSGVLTLESLGREGKVTFLEGQVIRATTSSSKINLGDMLVKHKLVDLETLKKALFIQRNSDSPPRIGQILSEKFGVPLEKIEEVAKEQIEKIVYGFFAWGEGTFSFELGEPGELASGSVNPLQLMLDQGLNPQWLAMEGSRILDERKHRGESIEEEDEEPIVDLVELLGEELADEIAGSEARPASAAAATDETVGGRAAATGEAAPGPPLFLVDDDQLTAQVIARQLRELNLAVSVFTLSKDFLKAVDAAVAAGQEPLLLVDLVMPKLDGSGISGGVEVARMLKEKYPDLVLMLMSDQITPELETKLRPLNLAALLVKPKKNLLSADKGKQILADMMMQIGQFVDPAAAGARTHAEARELGINFGAELLKEVNDVELQAKPTRIEPTPGIHLLGGMLQELNNPSLGGGIILLVLRFASELMNRAVIFFVKGDEIVGLGQFGIQVGSGSADNHVRQIKLPARAESVLARALADPTPKHTVFSSSEWDQYLIDQLGGRRPKDVFVGPIMSEGSAVAIIYGDNLPEQKEVGDTESFEIFLSQAGMAMERALLERRLKGGQAV